jgi:hypothetical protein
LTITLLCFSTPAFSQEKQPCGTSKDVRIVKDKPTVYLKFERYGKALDTMEQKMVGVSKSSNSVEKGKDIWLRLHNNSCWTISLTTQTSYVKRVPLADDPKKFKMVFGELKNNAPVNILYGIEEDDGKRITSGIDVYSSSKLLPGHSIIFSVRREHLAKKRSIYVDFSYEWEQEHNQTYRLIPESRAVYDSYRLKDEETR